MTARDIVLLSTADWDNPFWTNKQHVAVELARLGHRVLYINSLGLRRPSATARDLRRIARRLAESLRPPRRVRANLWVWSPIVLPWHGVPQVRYINRALLRAGTWVWIKLLRLKRPWLWTYNPMTLEFFDTESFSRCIYHCVDEIKAQPGMPVEALEIAEERLCRQVDFIFATSWKLTETRRVWNGNTYYLPNVADYKHFNFALASCTTVPEDLAALPAPRVGFIGALSGYKVDFRLIRRIAKAHPDWSLILIGEVGEGDPWTDTTLLDGLTNVHLLGPRRYEDLPGYLKGFDVALLPNRVNEYTDAMFPMKFFEYLAAGRPVVSVNLKALQKFGHVALLAETPEQFIAGIEAALVGQVATLDQRLQVASEYTYEARTRRMLELIDGV